ncbi:hypothetical protein SNEBB_009874 [Seison nebaliae]|nr:hypothetical protein SNEBB_009874 [Seison nebaliae]
MELMTNDYNPPIFQENLNDISHFFTDFGDNFAFEPFLTCTNLNEEEEEEEIDGFRSLLPIEQTFNRTIECDADNHMIMRIHENETTISLKNENLFSETTNSLNRQVDIDSNRIHGNMKNFPFLPSSIIHSNRSQGHYVNKSDPTIIDADKFLQEIETDSLGRVSAPRIGELPSLRSFDKLNLTDNREDDDMELLRNRFTHNLIVNHEEDEEKNEFIEDQHHFTETDLLLAKIRFMSTEEHISSLSTSKRNKNNELAIDLDMNHVISEEEFHEKVPNLAIRHDFPLDNFQKFAIMHLERHDNVFIVAHTSAGKTVVAEYAIALALKHQSKCIYTSPVKALSNQKYRDFRRIFGDENIGLLTGDIQLNRKANCFIMTTEILKSMLYNGAEIIRELEWVIFDEVHYINDFERGVVWEETLIMLPDHVSIVLLSATVPNAKQLAHWIGKNKKKKIYVIYNTHRPVPLEHNLFVEGVTMEVGEKPEKNPTFRFSNNQPPLHQATMKKISADKQMPIVRCIVDRHGKFNDQAVGYCTSMYKKAKRTSSGLHRNDRRPERVILEQLIRYCKKENLLSVVLFTFSRKICDRNATEICGHLSKSSTFQLNTKEEEKKIEKFFSNSLEVLRLDDRHLPQIDWMKRLVLFGIGVHHSGILPILRECVELLVQQSLVKVLFATETFAIGVNMPMRTVVFTGVEKFDGINKRSLNSGEYTQMAGRAGRRGLDENGTVLIMCRTGVPSSLTLRTMILGKPLFLQSKFRLTYGMLLRLLRVNDVRVEDMLKQSFYEFFQQEKVLSCASLLKTVKSIVDRLTLSNFQYRSCSFCQSDEYSMANYYRNLYQYISLRSEYNQYMFSTSNIPSFYQRFLTPGRVVVLKEFQGRLNVPAVILQIDGRRLSESFYYGTDNLPHTTTTTTTRLYSMNRKGTFDLKRFRQTVFYGRYDELMKNEKMNRINPAQNTHTHRIMENLTKQPNLPARTQFATLLICRWKKKSEKDQIDFQSSEMCTENDLDPNRTFEYPIDLEKNEIQSMNDRLMKLLENLNEIDFVYPEAIHGQGIYELSLPDSLDDDNFEIITNVEMHGHLHFITQCNLMNEWMKEISEINNSNLIINNKFINEFCDNWIHKNHLLEDGITHMKLSPEIRNIYENVVLKPFKNALQMWKEKDLPQKGSEKKSNKSQQKKKKKNKVIEFQLGNFDKIFNEKKPEMSGMKQKQIKVTLFDELTNDDMKKQFNLEQISRLDEISRIAKLLTTNEQKLLGCGKCPNFHFHFRQHRLIEMFNTQVKYINEMDSDQKLSHYKEYQNRLKLLKNLEYINEDEELLFKGRVAAAFISGQSEIFLTELLFQGYIVRWTPAELAAILSTLVFQNKAKPLKEINFTNKKLQVECHKIYEFAVQMAEKEQQFEICESVEDFMSNFHFGLVQATYDWSTGRSFRFIMNYLGNEEIQEGFVVRTMLRLNELLRSLLCATRLMGDVVLENKVKEAIESIKRDIVFAGSLYVK